MVIAKPFNITLNTKQVKALKDKNWFMFVGDDVVFNVQVLEDEIPKAFDKNSIITVLYTNNGVTIEQKSSSISSGITVVDSYNGILQIKPKSNSLTEGVNLVTIAITDQDENITLQQFMFVVKSTANNEIITDRKEDIETLTELSKVIQSLPNINQDLDTLFERIDEAERTIDDSIVEMQGRTQGAINNVAIETEQAINRMNTSVNDEISKVEDKVNGKLDELDTMFNKSVELEKYLNTSNKVCFTTNVINTTAKELVKYSYMIHINGSPYTSTLNTQAIGILNFNLEPNGVTTTITFIYNKSIQGNSLTATSKFHLTNSNVIPQGNFGYKIQIETNIISSGFDASRLVMTPIAGGLLL